MNDCGTDLLRIILLASLFQFFPALFIADGLWQ